jgi:hypothetical protein
MIRKMKSEAFETILSVMISSLNNQNDANSENMIDGFSVLMLEAMRVSILDLDFSTATQCHG